MNDWEERFRTWARPPDEAEEKRCENTIRMIREAIAGSEALRKRDVRAFVQGSFRNNTNVRRESDVDVGVICYDSIFSFLPPNLTDANAGLGKADYLYSTFKDELGRALAGYFGDNAVTRGNKAFDIKATRSQVEADVAPFFEHRRYDEQARYLSGVELRPDDGNPLRVINWPEQHYENGTSKNLATSRRYKAVVRMLKSLRYDMMEHGALEARPIIGFLIECLVWNVPNHAFGNATYTQDLRSTLIHLIHGTGSEETCGEWGEVSELKYLFRQSQKWHRVEAHEFLVAAWHYTGMA